MRWLVRWLGRWALVAGLALALVAPLAGLAAYPAEAASAWVTGVAFAPALWLVRPWHARLLAPPRAAGVAGAGLSRRAALRRLAESGVTLAGFALLGSFNAWEGAIGAALGYSDRVRGCSATRRRGRARRVSRSLGSSRR